LTNEQREDDRLRHLPVSVRQNFQINVLGEQVNMDSMRQYGLVRLAAAKAALFTLLVVAAVAMTAWQVLAQLPTPPETPSLEDKGVGPIKEVKLGAIDPQLAAKGEKVFATHCSVCHRLDSRYVGPPLRNVTKLRSPEWIMNMILNTNGMIMNDPVARDLVGKYGSIMTVSGIPPDDARAVLEYLRQVSEQQPKK